MMSCRSLPRGLRNNNPGNIRCSAVRYKGECAEGDGDGFRRFESMAYGYRAMFVLLHTYALRYGCRTIEAMISRYAPPSENDTQAYIRRVSRSAGVDARAAVDTTDGTVMPRIVGAMSAVENGTRADMAEVQAGWRLFAADI